MYVPEEVIYNERLVAEEEKTQPAGQGVHRNNKQDSNRQTVQPIHLY